MEKINELLEKRQDLSQQRKQSQSDWFIKQIDILLFNIDLELRQLSK